MANSAPLERTIVKKIMKYLDSLPNCKCQKTHGGQFGKAGTPDITGCIDGRRFDFEVKRPGGKVSPLQWKELREWEAAGGVTGVVYSVDDVKNILQKLHLVRVERSNEQYEQLSLFDDGNKCSPTDAN